MTASNSSSAVHLQTSPSDPVDWARIGNILDNKGFFDNEDQTMAMDKKSQLEQGFTEYCEEEEADSQFVRNEICEAYQNNDDKNFMFYSILADKLKYPLKKRHEFYHILLYNYFKLIDLNTSNIVNVLTKIIQKYDENVDNNNVEYIIRIKNIDGQTLQALINEDNCSKLADKLCDISIMKGDWRKIYQFLRIWGQHQFDESLTNKLKNEEGEEEKKYDTQFNANNLKTISEENDEEIDEIKNKNRNNNNDNYKNRECLVSNALLGINLSDLNVFNLCEWINLLPIYKHHYLPSYTKTNDTKICEKLSKFLYENQVNGQMLSENEHFDKYDFENMMKCLNCSDIDKYEWIWQCIHQRQDKHNINNDRLNSLEWMPSSWKRFVLINQTQTETIQREIKILPKLSYHDDDDNEVKKKEINKNKNKYDADELLWKQTAHLLDVKIKEIESQTEKAQRNVAKLNSKLAKKKYKIMIIEKQIENGLELIKIQKNKQQNKGSAHLCEPKTEI